MKGIPMEDFFPEAKFEYNEKTEEFEFKIPDNDMFKNCRLIKSPVDYLKDK